MSTLFTIVDDAHVILRRKGVYRQAKLYLRNGCLYAAWGSAFIGLRQNGTTLPDVAWEDIDLPDGVEACKLPLGRMGLCP